MASKSLVKRLIVQWICVRLQEKPKLHITGPLWRNPPVIGGFPSQRTSKHRWNDVNISIGPCTNPSIFSQATLCFRQSVRVAVRRLKYGFVVILPVLSVYPYSSVLFPLQWRHNGGDGVSNLQPHHCLLNRLFRRRLKKTTKLRVTGLCAGIHRWSVDSPHKWPVTRKMFPFDDVIIFSGTVTIALVGKIDQSHTITKYHKAQTMFIFITLNCLYVYIFVDIFMFRFSQCRPYVPNVWIVSTCIVISEVLYVNTWGSKCKQRMDPCVVS